ncbi:hypothetical protein ACOME3_006958 [Neoechinorhynchus agilis]
MTTKRALLEEILNRKISQILSESIPPHTVEFRPILYGTAGFRENAFDLKHISTRMGILIALRASAQKACVGVMVTASHNPPGDNGLKIIDAGGEMMDSKWESFANDLANSRNTQSLSACLTEHFSDSVNDISSLLTSEEITRGLLALRCGTSNEKDDEDDEFIEQFQKKRHSFAQDHVPSDRKPRVVIGFDNRSSSPDLVHRITSCLQSFGIQCVTFDHVTTPQLHYIVRCENNALFGDYGYPNVIGYQSKFGMAYINFKDATQGLRIIRQAIHILDGDHIAALICKFLSELATTRFRSDNNPFDGMRMGVVQTLYSNAASTNFLRNELKMNVVIAETGVKNLHREALKFDIGIYFEANGHGTVIYGNKFRKQVADKKRIACNNVDSDEIRWFSLLQNFMDMSNTTVGDAICDFLMVESILMYYSWNLITEWAEMYHDRPNVLTCVKVPDKSKFVVKGPMCELLAPKAVADQITKSVNDAVEDCRAFIRPSGTENVVRIYVEAETKNTAKNISDEIRECIERVCAKDIFVFD